MQMAKKSSISADLVGDILSIGFTASSFSGQCIPEISDLLKGVNLPTYTDNEIKKITNSLRNGDNLCTVLNNSHYTFPYCLVLLDAINANASKDTQVIFFASTCALYSFISCIYHVDSLDALPPIDSLIKSLTYALQCKQTFNISIRCLEFLFQLFMERSEPMQIYDILPLFLDFAKKVRCPDLSVKILKHIAQNHTDNRFLPFIREFTKATQFHYGYFADNSQISLAKILVPIITDLTDDIFKLILVSCQPMIRQTLDVMMPKITRHIFEEVHRFEPLVIPRAINQPPLYPISSVPKSEFGFPLVDTFINGFDPSRFVQFPKLIDLTSFFDAKFITEIQNIASCVKDDVNKSPRNIQFCITSFLSLMNEKSNDEYFGTFYVVFLILCNEISHSIPQFSINTEIAKTFFHTRIFDPGITIFSKDVDFVLINTLRANCLDYILSDEGDALDEILTYYLSSTPYLLAETLERISNVGTIFSSKCDYNPKLIKTLATIACFYQYLEVEVQCDKDAVRTARCSFFSMLAHLFSDPKVIRMFFSSILFVNSFLAFCFEKPIRPFIFNTLRVYLISVDDTNTKEIPSILYRIINFVDFRLPAVQAMRLLDDLIITLNECFTTNNRILSKFTDLCPLLCSTLRKLSTDNLSRLLYEHCISFFALMSPYFVITSLQIDAMISRLLAFNDSTFLASIYDKFIALLAGQQLTQLTPNFIVRQPQVFKVFLRTLFDTPRLPNIIHLIIELCKYSPHNMSACDLSDLDIYLLGLLEDIKKNENISHEITKLMLDLYSLLSVHHSTTQSVLRYISLMSPIDENHVSKYQNLFIETMNQIIIDSSNEPFSSFPLNGTKIKGKPFSANIEKGFGFAFWIYLEPSNSDYRPQICTINFGNHMKFGLFVSNNSILTFQNNGDIETTGMVVENLEPHTWHFIYLTYTFSEKRSYLHYQINCQDQNMLTVPVLKKDIVQSSLRFTIGGRCYAKTDLPSKIAAIGVYPILRYEELISIFELGLRHNENPPGNPFDYYIDFKKYDTTVDKGFVDVLVHQCGLDSLMPLFLQSDYKLTNEEPFIFPLDTVLTLFSNVLLFSIDAQISFFQNKGFNIFAQLLMEYWTKQFTIKIYLQLFQLLLSIQYEQLQQQLFDEVMTNFTFMMHIDPTLHLRILKHWSQSLFSSFKIIAQNFSNFDDLLAILRMFYWYQPIESLLIHYQDVRSPNLNIKACRKYILLVLYSYASDSFSESDFKSLTSHCISCVEVEQVLDLLNFLLRIITELKECIAFNLENKDFRLLIHYYLQYPSEDIRLKVIEILIEALHSHLVSKQFFIQQVETSISILPDHAITKTAFDYLNKKLLDEPLLLPLCCFIAYNLKDPSFILSLAPNTSYTTKEFWAIWPLILSYTVSPDEQNKIFMFLIKCSHGDNSQLFAQLDLLMSVIPEASRELEDRFISAFYHYYYNHTTFINNQAVDDFYELCQRVIFFSPNGMKSSLEIFYESYRGIKENSHEDLVNDLPNKFFTNDIPPPGIALSMKFDEKGNWNHIDLALLCIEIFRKYGALNHAPLFIMIFTYLSACRYQEVHSIIPLLNLTEREINDNFDLIELLNYHAFTTHQVTYFRQQFTSSTPLIKKKESIQVINQITPRAYKDYLEDLYQKLCDHRQFVAHLKSEALKTDISSLVMVSSLQMQQFIERQAIQNAANLKSWTRLWSTLSIERAPWHITRKRSSDESFSREMSAGFGFAPLKMIRRTVQYSQSPDDAIISSRCAIINENCTLISLHGHEESYFRLFTTLIQICIKGSKTFSIPVSNLQYIFKRTNHTLQFFMSNRQSFLIQFQNDDSCLDVMCHLCSIEPKYYKHIQKTSNKLLFRELPVQGKWKINQMSNYEYLLWLNTISGRSFNDISRYPVFPWVISDFSGESIPIPTTENIKKLFSRQMNQIPLNEHAVYTYLRAIEPFTSLSVNQQIHECFSMDDFLNFSQTNGNVEIVPEFFSMPEICMDPSFALPMWANSPAELVYLQRKVLESDAVSMSLHIWINSVWGPHGDPQYQLFDNYHPQKDTNDSSPILKHTIEHVVNINQLISAQITDPKPMSFDILMLHQNGTIYEVKLDRKSIDTKLPSSASNFAFQVTSFSSTDTLQPKVNRFHHPAFAKNMPSMPDVQRIQPSSKKKPFKIPEPNYVVPLHKNRFAITSADSTIITVIDVSNNRTSLIETTKAKISCIDADGHLMVAGCDDASILIIRDLKIMQSIQLYREAVTACAINSTHSLVVSGTKDGAIILCSTINGNLIRIINVPNLKPQKLMITPSWGFIVAYFTEIEDGDMKYFIYVYTVNGIFIAKTEIPGPIDFWYVWSSNNGFDYLVFTIEGGKLYFAEVFYMRPKEIPYVEKQKIIAASISLSTSTLVAITRNGRIYLMPITYQ